MFPKVGAVVRNCSWDDHQTRKWLHCGVTTATDLQFRNWRRNETFTLNPKAAESVPQTRTSRKAKETETHQINAIELYENEERVLRLR